MCQYQASTSKHDREEEQQVTRYVQHILKHNQIRLCWVVINNSKMYIQNISIRLQVSRYADRKLFLFLNKPPAYRTECGLLQRIRLRNRFPLRFHVSFRTMGLSACTLHLKIATRVWKRLESPVGLCTVRSLLHATNISPEEHKGSVGIKVLLNMCLKCKAFLVDSVHMLIDECFGYWESIFAFNDLHVLITWGKFHSVDVTACKTRALHRHLWSVLCGRWRTLRWKFKDFGLRLFSSWFAALITQLTLFFRLKPAFALRRAAIKFLCRSTTVRNRLYNPVRNKVDHNPEITPLSPQMSQISPSSSNAPMDIIMSFWVVVGHHFGVFHILYNILHYVYIILLSLLQLVHCLHVVAFSPYCVYHCLRYFKEYFHIRWLLQTNMLCKCGLWRRRICLRRRICMSVCLSICCLSLRCLQLRNHKNWIFDAHNVGQSLHFLTRPF